MNGDYNDQPNQKLPGLTIAPALASTDRSDHTIVSELSESARIKLEVVQFLLEPRDRQTYGERLREASTKLGVSVRTVQRLFKQYQEQGLAALVSSDRADERGLISVKPSFRFKRLAPC